MNLNEVKLSRVWQHYNDEDTSLVIMTAFRGNLSEKENKQRNKALAADIKNAGFGYFYVDGYWIENKGTPNERKVKEDSIFITSDVKDEKKLINLCAKKMKELDQDAIFIKDSSGSYLLDKTHKKSQLKGEMKPGKLGDFYTKLRNNKTSTFVFEKERESLGFFGSFREFINK